MGMPSSSAVSAASRALLADDGKRPEDSTIDEMDALWQRAKAGE